MSIQKFYKYSAKLWNFVDGHWVIFKLNPGKYINIIDFLQSSDILFVADLKIDFTNIPIQLHGRGNSKNLFKYIENNMSDVVIISNFITYFLNTLLNLTFLTGNKVNFYLVNHGYWQDLELNILNSMITVDLSVDSDLFTCDSYILTCDQITYNILY